MIIIVNVVTVVTSITDMRQYCMTRSYWVVVVMVVVVRRGGLTMKSR